MAVSQGDRLSAGTDRTDEQQVEAESYMRARLLSAFNYIQLSEEAVDPQSYRYYPLAPLNEDPFPKSLEQAQQTSYSELFDAFLGEMQHLPCTMGTKHYIDSLQSLLEKYMWCVPSSTYKTDPDVSLFDHGYTTAAMAQALAVYHQEQGGMPGENTKDVQKFLLFGGDLSGIQKYIFSIEKSHGTGVAKILRARSFLLQAVTRSVVNVLLEELDLMPQARIMDAGGQFILLLPNTERVRSHLPGFEARVQRWFLESFQGEVSLPLSYDVELEEQDMKLDRFHARLNDFHDSLQRRKLHRFDALFEDGFSPVFPLDHSEYHLGACQVCNIHPADTESSNRFFEEYDREISICKRCFGQIDTIGKHLPRSRYILFSRVQTPDSLELFGGIYLRLIKEVENKHQDALEIVDYRRFGSFAHLPIAGHLPSYSEEDITELKAQGELRESGSNEWIWIGEEEPVRPDAPKTLNMLAHRARIFDGENAKPRGKAFLGALKADVDNLGLIFGSGLSNRLSISRYSFLSRMLNHFFADHLIDRIRERFPDIYVVFAGGDDLFFLGPWCDMVDMAQTIADEFDEYTARNPNISLSGGISIHKPGEPVHGIVHRAEELLDRSKERELNGETVKNGATLFGVTVDWQRFRELIEKGRWIENLILDGMVTKGLAGRMLYYADQHNRLMQGDIEAGIYRAHMEYDFKRNVYDHMESHEKDEWNQIAAGLKDVQEMDLLRLPVTWALYRVRTDA
jgi:CRISPR-associated protein Csm1